MVFGDWLAVGDERGERATICSLGNWEDGAIHRGREYRKRNRLGMRDELSLYIHSKLEML